MKEYRIAYLTKLAVELLRPITPHEIRDGSWVAYIDRFIHDLQLTTREAELVWNVAQTTIQKKEG